MAASSDLLSKLDQQLVAIYAAKTGRAAGDVQAWMDAETWFTADGAKAAGLADSVEKITPPAAPGADDPAALPAQPATPAQLASFNALLNLGRSSMPTNASADPEKKETTMADPTNTPQAADPVAVAQACQAAGFPQLTARLLSAKADMAGVEVAIANAKTITEAAEKVGLTNMAGPLVASGASVETAREILFAAKAQVADATTTDPTQRPGNQAQAPVVNFTEIYDRFNKPRAA
jgi:hypothetical protein